MAPDPQTELAFQRRIDAHGERFVIALTREALSQIARVRHDLSEALGQIARAGPEDWAATRALLEADRVLESREEEARSARAALERCVTWQGRRRFSARQVAEHEALSSRIEEIGARRLALRVIRPEIALLDGAEIERESDAELRARAERQAPELGAALEQLAARITHGNVALDRFSGLVERTFLAEGLDDPDNDAGALVRTWLAQQRTEHLLGETMTDLAQATLVLGATLTGSLPLLVAGAFVTGAGAGARFWSAENMVLATKSSLTGADRMVDPELADRERVMAWANLALGAFDVGAGLHVLAAGAMMTRIARGASAEAMGALARAEPRKVSAFIRAFETGDAAALAKAEASLDAVVRAPLLAELEVRRATGAALGLEGKSFEKLYADFGETLRSIGPANLAVLSRRLGPSRLADVLARMPRSAALIEAAGPEAFVHLVKNHGPKMFEASIHAFGEKRTLALLRGAGKHFGEIYESANEVMVHLARTKRVDRSAAEAAKVVETHGVRVLRRIDAASERGIGYLLESGVRGDDLVGIWRANRIPFHGNGPAPFAEQMVEHLSRLPRSGIARELKFASEAVEMDLRFEGHVVTRHGPQIPESAHWRRVDEGVAPDGKRNAFTSVSSSFGSFESLVTTQKRAIEVFERKYGHTGADIVRHAEALGAIEKVEHVADISGGRVEVWLDSEIVAEHPQLTLSRAVKRNGAQTNRLSRTRTKMRLNYPVGRREEATWSIGQHLPEAKDYDFAVHGYRGELGGSVRGD